MSTFVIPSLEVDATMPTSVVNLSFSRRLLVGYYTELGLGLGLDYA